MKRDKKSRFGHFYTSHVCAGPFGLIWIAYTYTTIGFLLLGLFWFHRSIIQQANHTRRNITQPIFYVKIEILTFYSICVFFIALVSIKKQNVKWLFQHIWKFSTRKSNIFPRIAIILISSNSQQNSNWNWSLLQHPFLAQLSSHLHARVFHCRDASIFAFIWDLPLPESPSTPKFHTNTPHQIRESSLSSSTWLSRLFFFANKIHVFLFAHFCAIVRLHASRQRAKTFQMPRVDELLLGCATKADSVLFF